MILRQLFLNAVVILSLLFCAVYQLVEVTREKSMRRMRRDVVIARNGCRSAKKCPGGCPRSLIVPICGGVSRPIVTLNSYIVSVKLMEDYDIDISHN